MIGNAIDKTLDNIGCSDCHIDGNGDVSGDVNITAPIPKCNATGLECDSLKVEMAVTLAFLTGIIMVHTLYLQIKHYNFFGLV